jgi:cytochrome c oxidase assembly factor CtaG
VTGNVRTWVLAGSAGALFYGAPVVALLAIFISFFTASRRWGIVVPLCRLALLIADVVILAVTASQ